MIVKPIFIGDIAECLKWYPFALTKLREIDKGTQKLYIPYNGLSIKLSRGQYITRIIIRAYPEETKEERRFLYAWEAYINRDIGYVTDFFSVHLTKYRGRELIEKRIDKEIATINLNEKEVTYKYGRFVCGRFDITNPDEFACVFVEDYPKQGDENNWVETSTIRIVKFKIVKYDDYEIVEIGTIGEYQYNKGIYSRGNFMQTYYLDRALVTYAQDVNWTYIVYDIVDIFVKGSSFKILANVSTETGWMNEYYYFHWDGVGHTSKTLSFKDEIVFGGFNDSVDTYKASYNFDIYTAYFAYNPSFAAGAAHNGTGYINGTDFNYGRTILNEDDFLYVKAPYQIEISQGYQEGGWSGGDFNYQIVYNEPSSIHTHNGVGIFVGTEDMANYETVPIGGGPAQPIGWEGVRDALVDHSRYFSIIRSDGKYSFIYNIRYNIEFSIGNLIFEYQNFKYASTNSDFDMDNMGAFFLGVPTRTTDNGITFEGIGLVDFLGWVGGGGLSWSTSPYVDFGFDILPFCRYKTEDNLIYVRVLNNYNRYGWYYELINLLYGTPIPDYAYWMLIDGEYYLSSETYGVSSFMYIRKLCDAGIIQRGTYRTKYNGIELDKNVKLLKIS
jgi:hypothetical protein